MKSCEVRWAVLLALGSCVVSFSADGRIDARPQYLNSEQKGTRSTIYAYVYLQAQVVLFAQLLEL
jgi:hypothetical protein